jgi:hypothetical protein
MTEQQPQQHCDHECVCPSISQVQRSRKESCVVYGCPHDTRPHTGAPSEERIGSIRTNVFMCEQKEWLIERVNAGMGEWEYVISYLGEYFATAPSELIAKEIQEAYSDRATITAQAWEKVLKDIGDYIEDNSPWIPGTDERVTDSRKLMAHLKFLRTTPTPKEQEQR